MTIQERLRRSNIIMLVIPILIAGMHSIWNLTMRVPAALSR